MLFRRHELGSLRQERQDVLSRICGGVGEGAETRLGFARGGAGKVEGFSLTGPTTDGRMAKPKIYRNGEDK